MKRATFACLLTLVAATARAEVYYVNPRSGDDAAAGSEQHPFRTIARAVALVDGPGGEVRLVPGGGPYLEPIVVHRGGTATQPLVVDGQGSLVNLGTDITAGPWTPLAEGYRLERKLTQNPRVYLTSPVFVDGLPVFCDHPKGPAVAPRAAHGGYLRYEPDGHLVVVFPRGHTPENSVVVATGATNYMSCGVQLLNATHVVIRNVISVFSGNDGFNIHGTSSDVLLDHVTALFNSDEGISSHDTCVVLVTNSEVAFNGTQDGGITDVNHSVTTYRHLWVHQNRGAGFSFKGARHQAEDSVSFGNGGRNLPLPGPTITVTGCRDLGGVPPGAPGNDRLARFLAVRPPSEPPARWRLESDGSIGWQPKGSAPHSDQMEMDGERVALIVSYGVAADGRFAVDRQLVWPQLRFAPNRTRDHLTETFGEDALPRFFLDRTALPPPAVTAVKLRGLMRIEGAVGAHRELEFRRTLFASAANPLGFDRWQFTNRSGHAVTFAAEANERTIRTDPARSLGGPDVAFCRVLGAGERTLAAGASTDVDLVFGAEPASQPIPGFAPAAEEAAAQARVDHLATTLQLQTPDPVLNRTFAFAMIRAGQSITATRNGPILSPGGGQYYAGAWANDHGEYSGPFFAYWGDAAAQAAALNAYRWFARKMNPRFEALPSALVSEGEVPWHGVGDRGDMAMLAAGAARYVLARGDRTVAAELWPFVQWCLDYCRRHLTADGVLATDSDELEGRFPSGKANLSAACEYYDGLVSAGDLARDLGSDEAGKAYAGQAAALRRAINRHFGATVDGFATYRYYDRAELAGDPKFGAYADRPDVLRAWIGAPLAVGITERASGTLAALFSPRLWTVDGLATEEGRPTFWDRSTLYALRGAFIAGDTARAYDQLAAYSRRRLLGEHVPYPIEAYPENGQRQMAGESALYGRVIVEGLFGLRPAGLRRFRCRPRLPDGWPEMVLQGIDGFGHRFDLRVERAGRAVSVRAVSAGKDLATAVPAPGGEAELTLP